MKKFLLSLTALLMVAFTTVALSSCTKDDDNTGGIVAYQCGMDVSQSYHVTDPNVLSSILSTYEMKLKSIPGATFTGDVLQFAAGSSTSSCDALVKKACAAAEAELSTYSTSDYGFFYYTVDRVKVKGSENIYSKMWGSK